MKRLFRLKCLWSLGVMGLAAGAGTAAESVPAAPERPGYTDTPLIPNTNWHVHDSQRPCPAVVAPATPGSTETSGSPPPADAVILFGGQDLSKWRSAKDGGAARWLVANGYMEINKTGDIQTVDSFGDCQLHVEWAAPTPPTGSSQNRGNSGVFLMGRYEIQVLDSYQNPTYADGQAAAIYGQYPPLVNACRPPGEWQTYDIFFEAPTFKGKELATPAFVKVIHNGILVQDRVQVLGSTTHKKLAGYTAHPPTGPIRLQDHGSPVRYRNIWMRPLKPAE